MAVGLKTTIVGDKATLVSGNIYFMRGTYNASGVTKGEIDLTAYFSELIEANLHPMNGTPTLRYGTNMSENGTASTAFNGFLGIAQAISNATGQWFVLGKL